MHKWLSWKPCFYSTIRAAKGHDFLSENEASIYYTMVFGPAIVEPGRATVLFCLDTSPGYNSEWE